jgi:hypothetical protein
MPKKQVGALGAALRLVTFKLKLGMGSTTITRMTSV